MGQGSDNNVTGDVLDFSPTPANLDSSHFYDELDLASPGGGYANVQGLDNQAPPDVPPQHIVQDGSDNDSPPAEPHEKPVIVLDPGHSGEDISSIDPQTGLHDHDYPNNPEINEAWNVAQKVGANLEAAGYDVVFTKDSALDSVSLRERANIAEQEDAALAVSIHDDHGQDFDSFGQVFAQEVGGWRGGTADDPQAVFTNEQIAAESQAAAANFVAERARAEGRPVELTQVNFAGRPGIDPGNITQVQLYAGEGPNPVPWVYNEVGGIGYGPEQEAAYVQGLTEAIKKSVPLG